MKDIRNSILLKMICYISIPILVVLLIVNSISIQLSIDYDEDMKGYTDYFNTSRYASDFLDSIYYSVRNLNYNNQAGNLIIEHEVIDEINEEPIIYSNLLGYNEAVDIVIVTLDGTVYTNIDKTVKTDTFEGLRERISGKNRKWEYSNGSINTNIAKMKYEEIAYNPQFEYIQQRVESIYVAIRDENSQNFYWDKLVYGVVEQTYQMAPFVVVVSLLLLLAAIAYIIISIGHKKGKEEIYTNGLDRIPLEILLAGVGIALGLEVAFLELFMSINIEYINIIIAMGILWGTLVYITLAIAGVTIIRRIKAKVFVKNSLTYKIVFYLKRKANSFIKEVFKNFGRTTKLAVVMGGFTLISMILFLFAIDNFFFALLLLAFWYISFRKSLKEVNKIYEIRDKIKNIYNGDIEEQLEEEEFKGELKEVVHEINDISGGLSNAIEQGVKSERLKTELITNVSHDIKTPLTSIINYVDLLKKEEIQNEQVQEYLKILDNKSQRLKKLTEDLVEASKASSGNIKLTIERLNVKELMKQVTGEFEDKFEEQCLQMIQTLPKEEIYINADSKYMYRVLENMYINVVKYALENSRVYVDISKKESMIRIEIKNISRDKLNITEEELMQRFVRGDSSRTTEGSGLGISIAKSLTELQKGKFDLYLDGDLFKVVIQFPAIQ